MRRADQKGALMSHDIIVVASDLSGASDRVVRTAGELASALAARIVAVHVLTDARLKELQETLPHESMSVDAVLDRLRLDLDEQLLRETHGIETSTEIVIGHEAPNVLAIARDRNADLLVIGIRNRSRIGKLITGSVTQELLLDSTCPVVAVPT
jgi:nucleotide-binding universal stress UspA family protein